MEPKRLPVKAATALALVAVALTALIGFAPPTAADPVVSTVITAGSALGEPAVDVAANRVYVGDQKTATLFAIDGATSTVTGSLAIAGRLATVPEVAADPKTHRVYVTTDNDITVVDGLAMQIIDHIGSGFQFTQPVVMPSTGRLYAVTSDPGSTRLQLAVFSDTGTRLATVALGNALADTGP